ncbi:MAG TPA: SigB/SigF/SigG family RNA polymerase sigma factor [Solirubrobacteraceae bacterium]|nr:SigB/SigF/SigG family RNA polymerase sigma factor [Solirubrobacteraceae bacterium]
MAAVSNESPSRPVRARSIRKGEPGPAESTTLFKRWRAGDAAARERLAEGYGPLARNLARRYLNTSEPYEDLCQVAQLGLIKAIERFDPARGFPFQAFAIPTILGELRRHFRNCSWSVHVPRGVQERALELRDVERALGEEHGRAPTICEIAQFMELSTEEVLDGLQALRGFAAVSLDAPRGSEPGDEAGSFIETVGEDDHHYELVELRSILTDAMARLDPRLREMLRLRFFEELTQTQIAARLGVSQMQVSRLLRRCLDQLHDGAEESSLPVAA